jgi:hypothetical protein
LLQVAISSQTASATPYTLYRLTVAASSAQQWQSLGTVPELTVLYTSTPRAGVLWAVPAVGVVLDPQQCIFTVDYTP